MTLFPPDKIPETFTLDMQIREVEIEIAVRRSVYERQVAKGAMTPATAAKKIGCMNAVLETLKGLRG